MSKGKEIAKEPTWKLPPLGTHKLNTDGGWRHIGRGSGGAVIRTHTGSWVFGLSCKFKAKTAAGAELMAMKEGLLQAKKYGISKLIVESDAKDLLLKIAKAKQLQHHDLYPIIDEVAMLLNDPVWSAEVCCVPRSSNMVAHDMTMYGMRMNVVRKDYISVPDYAAKSFKYDLEEAKTC